MLINDSVTVATEVPVYLTEDDIKYFKSRSFTFDFENFRTPITGHIDILQIRNGLIHKGFTLSSSLCTLSSGRWVIPLILF